MSINFTKADMDILKAVISDKDEKKGLTLMTGTKIEELTKKTGFSSTKVRITVQNLLKEGYLKEGFMDGRTKTYVMTHEGILFIKESAMNIFDIEDDNEEDLENE